MGDYGSEIGYAPIYNDVSKDKLMLESLSVDIANIEYARVEIAKPRHRDGILLLAENVFLKGEPVRVALQLQWEDVREAWEKMVDECLKRGHSHVAVHSTGGVVGFRLTDIIDLEKCRPGASLNEFVQPPIVKAYLDFLTKDWAENLINEKGERCKKLLHFLAVAVHPNYGGQRIGERMCRENLALGERLGCDYCLVVASNWMSQRIFEKLGFTTMARISYSDLAYLEGGNGQIIDVVDPTQKGSKSMIKKLGH